MPTLNSCSKLELARTYIIKQIDSRLPILYKFGVYTCIGYVPVHLLYIDVQSGRRTEYFSGFRQNQCERLSQTVLRVRAGFKSWRQPERRVMQKARIAD